MQQKLFWLYIKLWWHIRQCKLKWHYVNYVDKIQCNFICILLVYWNRYETNETKLSVIKLSVIRLLNWTKPKLTDTNQPKQT